MIEKQKIREKFLAFFLCYSAITYAAITKNGRGARPSGVTQKKKNGMQTNNPKNV